MQLPLLRAGILTIGVAATWLAAGRRLTLLLDQVLTVRRLPLPVNPFRYEGGGFLIGGLRMSFGGIDNLRFKLDLRTDSRRRVVLSTGGKSFVLGPRADSGDSSKWTDIDIAPDPGDQFSFTSSRSILPWPTPFEYRILGGASPWWKRYVYFRLRWAKPSGAKLEMLWRYEQQLFSAKGWTEPQMMWNSQTGLLKVEIQPAKSKVEETVERYIRQTKGWNPREYRIESRGLTANELTEMIAVVYLQDERSPHPGGGQSIELHVDRASLQVVRELGAQ
jgi:hypothetical protein